MDGVVIGLLVKGFAVVAIVGGVYFLGDVFVPWLSRYWPNWLFKKALFTRHGEGPQSPR
jgi:hypothetical protein